MIPLITRSHFSLMWGTASPEELVLAAKRLGYSRLALTDTDNLYGLWLFLKACSEHGLTPIVGAEITDPKSANRAVCLVESDEGFASLCRLLTRRKQDKTFDLAAALSEQQAGLTFLTTSPDLLARLHEAGVSVAAMLPRKPNQVATKAREAARRLGLAAVAVPSSFFLAPEDHELHRLLRAINLNTSFSRLTAQDVAQSDAYLAAPSDYAARFAIWPETLRASEELAERLTFRGPKHGLVMPPWTEDVSRSAAAILRERTYDGARWRYGAELSETVVARLERELVTIERMGFSSYFLVVERIVKRSPRICGRGSGAASIVAYCLGITNVCPIKFNLYFERFLNPGRKDPPDIDVDFAWDERDAVINSVLAEYEGYAAMVAVHQGFQPRGAIRETAKVFGLTDGEIGQVAKRLPWFWRAVEEEDGDDALLARLRTLPQLKEIDFPDPWPEVLRLAQRLIGLPRQLSVHPGGVVITPRAITDYAPIETAPKGVPILQWEKDGTEDAGLVKIDLLGNRSLGVIRDAINNLKANGHAFNDDTWEPEDDAATQARIARGETMGCFYIESPATRLLQQKAKTGDYEHVVIHSSIIRPAANKFIHEYLRRLHGGAWTPIHPLLAGVLDETYGIMVYQEDVSKAAVALAGFDHVEADGLRKVMSKKDREKRLPDYLRRFVEGARARGVSDEQIAQVWEMILSFDGYSFCKPHSASYARVSFQAAYLKEHVPAEFMAAVISNEGGFYSPFAYVSEARRLGCTILPLDVNASEVRWRGKGRELRVGLLSIKGLSDDTQARIVATRAARPYRDLADFLARVRPAEDEARALIYARAFEALHPGEPQAALLWTLSAASRQAASSRRTGDLFEARMNVVVPPPPPFAPEPPLDLLRREYAALGFLCDVHPMTLFAERLRRERLVKACDLARFVGRRVRIAGFLITGKVVGTSKGEPMEFVTFEDETGVVETTFFPDTYRRFCHMLDHHFPYILEGKIEEDFGALTLTVEYVSILNIR